jgi:hypothetical protein
MINDREYILGSEWWLNSYALTFSEILSQSRIPEHWARHDLAHLVSLPKILKPVNKYVFSLYPRPEIVSIVGNLVKFRQRTHAEIWVKPKWNNTLYALDKCHQRQFYPSEKNINIDGCFNPTYRFYMPWFINKSLEISIKQVNDEETPFCINERSFFVSEVSPESRYVDAEFIDFKIKKTGKYMVDGKYGIIDKGTAMYDMFVLLDNKEIEELKHEYRK